MPCKPSDNDALCSCFLRQRSLSWPANPHAIKQFSSSVAGEDGVKFKKNIYIYDWLFCFYPPLGDFSLKTCSVSQTSCWLQFKSSAEVIQLSSELQLKEGG